MFGLLSFVFGLLLYWGLISLPATTRRDGILPGASDVMGSISHSLYFFFFLVENPWACRERATCNGLAVGLVLFYIYIYIFFFFSDFSSNFFWVFFFFLLESRTDNFFFKKI